MAALRALRQVQADRRPATAEEQAVLARWSSWGALPGVFDDGDGRWAEVRAEVRQLVDEPGWRAAARTTINAHYTPAEVASTMWGAARQLGFAGGRCLEPGCGAGTFIGVAPSDLAVEMVGVELDPASAAIAAALYPHATIRNESFADTRLPDGFFDLAIGNVPFGKIALHDPRHNRNGHSLHNHFLLKSLHLVRPGGLVVSLTSRFTLDARNPAARREMADLADLVGAVRLPEGAFRQVAGTDVVIDLVVLRRRADGEPRSGVGWERSVDMATADGPVTANEVFVAHPEWVLGELSCVNGQYNDHDLTVKARPGPLGPQLAEAVEAIATEARAAGLTMTTAPREAARTASAARAEVTLGAHHKEGSLLVTPTGLFARVEGGVAVRFEPSPKNGAAELRAVIGLRDAFHEVLAAQTGRWDDTLWEAARRRLNERYDQYTANYGPLNRSKLERTGRRHPETGEDLYRRKAPPMGGFKRDPDLPAVLALENFDPDTGHATKAAIFERRVLEPRQARLGADTAEDALAICLDDRGHPDLGHIAGLLGVEPEEARAALGAMVYDDPAGDGTLATAAAYLSGDVRAKLAAARAAAEGDGRWEVNVDALVAVQPADLGPEEIDARLGAPWIPAGDVADFVRQVLECRGAMADYDRAVGWTVTAPSYQRNTVVTTSEWGTDRMDAVALVHAACNQQQATVYDYDADGTRTVNSTATSAAREKQEALGDKFAEWVWQDQARAERLAEVYNARFNSTVVPSYDGSHLSLPGMSEAFKPNPHQLNAAWRIISEPTVLLAHAVGAGKTASMIIGGREMKRLGLIAKPAYVVPNHLLEQFSREYLQLFPGARLLVASKEDVTPAARKNFVARCATGDWDAVLMTGPSFLAIPVSDEDRARFMADKIADFRDAITAARERGGLSVKQLQAALLREEQRHAKLLAADRKDDGVNFSATGIDYIFLDESHLYKNLQRTSHIQGAGHKGSQRAEDLDMKLSVLRERHGARVATFATATPIANSIGEMFVVQRYLQPEALEAAGIATFDAWAATFGRTVTALELSPDGSSYRMATRFARFANVPELLTMFGGVADVRTRDQLQLAVPDLPAGAETVIVEPDDGLRQYMKELAARTKAVSNRTVRPEVDNILKINGDGRRAALNLRLVGRPPDPAGGKLAAAADRIAHIWAETAEVRLPGPRRPAVAAPGQLAAGVLRHGHPQAGRVVGVRGAPRPPGAPRRAPGPGPVHPRGDQRQSQGRTVRRRAATGGCRCWSAPPRRWAWGSTSRPGRSPCTTSTARGGPPTWSSVTGGSSARATRTARSGYCATPPRPASTCTCGRPAPARRRSSTR